MRTQSIRRLRGRQRSVTCAVLPTTLLPCGQDEMHHPACNFPNFPSYVIWMRCDALAATFLFCERNAMSSTASSPVRSLRQCGTMHCDGAAHALLTSLRQMRPCPCATPCPGDTSDLLRCDTTFRPPPGDAMCCDAYFFDFVM